MANAIDEPRFIVLVSLCLDSTDVQWMNKHIRDQEIPWNEFRKAFISHFQHPDATVVWQNQIRSLKMDNSGVQRYSDQFIWLATRLNWDLSHELAIYQFKLGLPGWLNKQLTTAEVARGSSLPVEELAKMALQIEAVTKQQMHQQNVNNTMKLKSTLNNSHKREIKCFDCGE